MEKSDSIPVMSVSGLSSPPAWRTIRAAQNPVTPSNTPVITGVFAKQANVNKNTTGTTSAEDDVTEKLKKLGQ